MTENDESKNKSANKGVEEVVNADSNLDSELKGVIEKMASAQGKINTAEVEKGQSVNAGVAGKVPEVDQAAGKGNEGSETGDTGR